MGTLINATFVLEVYNNNDNSNNNSSSNTNCDGTFYEVMVICDSNR